MKIKECNVDLINKYLERRGIKMEQTKLNEILRKHKLWLEDDEKGERANLEDADLEGADLKYANLKYANLKGANLQDADLQRANLQGANLDFSCLPLWCGGLNFKIDERIAKQITYHLINLMQYSDLKVSKIFKKEVYKWLEDSHLVKERKLLKIEEKEVNENVKI